jgi:hypothetical protein
VLGLTTGQPCRTVARYLLVDDRNGRILAELASARQAEALLARIEGSAYGASPVSLVVLDHRRGLDEVKSLVSMQALPQPPRRPGPRTPSPDRPIDFR